MVRIEICNKCTWKEWLPEPLRKNGNSWEKESDEAAVIDWLMMMMMRILSINRIISSFLYKFIQCPQLISFPHLRSKSINRVLWIFTRHSRNLHEVKHQQTSQEHETTPQHTHAFDTWLSNLRPQDIGSNGTSQTTKACTNAYFPNSPQR